MSNNNEALTDETYKVKLNELRNRYLGSLELGIEYIDESIETLRDVQENGRSGDRVKAASTLMSKISDELNRADRQQQHAEAMEAAKGGSGNIPVDAAVKMMKGLAEAFGMDTNDLSTIRHVESSHPNRISPTPGDESLPFHSPESARTDAQYPDKESGKNENSEQIRKGQDFLQSIRRGQE